MTAIKDTIDGKMQAIFDRFAAIDLRQPAYDPAGIRAAYARWQIVVGVNLPIRLVTDPVEAGIWASPNDDSGLAAADGDLVAVAARSDSWVSRFWVDTLAGRIPMQTPIIDLYPQAGLGADADLPPATSIEWNVATAWASLLFMGQMAQGGAEKWIEASVGRIAGAPEILRAVNLLLPFGFYGPWGPPVCVALGLRNALAACSKAELWDKLAQTDISQSRVAQKLRELGIRAEALGPPQREQVIGAFIMLCEPMLAACESGAFAHVVAGSEVIVLASPSIWTDGRRLHRADGPAVAWQHTKVHAWKGVFVPEQLLLQPHTITVDTIRGAADPLLQDALVDMYAHIHGHRRSIQDLGGVMAHEDTSGRLWCVNPARPPAQPQPGDIKLVEVLNGTVEPDGSRKTYWLRVPPWTRTAQEAVAWTYGLTPEEYGGLVVRT